MLPVQCAVKVAMSEMEDVKMQGGCCYNYYREYKCICIHEAYPAGEKGKYPSECNTTEGGYGPGVWVQEGTHNVNCTGAPGPPAAQDTPAPYFTHAVQNLKLESACTDQPFCLDSATSKGSCYDASDNPSSGHAVVCNVKKSDCVGDMSAGTAGEAARDGRYTWFPPGYAMPDRDGVKTCCHCNAGCDHAQENKDLDCENTVGYRDVTSPSCNRKDGVLDRENAGHPDLADYTIGRKKCPIPQGVLSTSSVVRHLSEKPTQASIAILSAGGFPCVCTLLVLVQCLMRMVISV